MIKKETKYICDGCGKTIGNKTYFYLQMSCASGLYTKEMGSPWPLKSIFNRAPELILCSLTCASPALASKFEEANTKKIITVEPTLSTA